MRGTGAKNETTRSQALLDYATLDTVVKQTFNDLTRLADVYLRNADCARYPNRQRPPMVYCLATQTICKALSSTSQTKLCPANKRPALPLVSKRARSKSTGTVARLLLSMPKPPPGSSTGVLTMRISAWAPTNTNSTLLP